MFAVIADFLLEPTLLTIGLLGPAAALMAWALERWARARRPARAPASLRRHAWILALGLAGSALSVLGCFSLGVMVAERLSALAWVGVLLSWSLAWGLAARVGAVALPAAALITLCCWGLDAYVTAAILFE